MVTYEYDHKYQFNNNKLGTPDFGSNSFTEALNKNREYGLSYDANGNIKSLNRTGHAGTIQNSLAYNYQSNTNKLAAVDNYATCSYDDLGQMVSQAKGTDSMFLDYDVSGKITAIYSGSERTVQQLKVSFTYDESGMRVKKTSYGPMVISTYYVHDASGNVLAVYDNNGTALAQKEIPVYSLTRIAIFNKQNNSYQYELSDHLGNVRAVIGQSKTPQGQADVLHYSDYYPFGSEMTLANSDYRYGYQGQYAEKDKETGWNNFQLRMYDPTIARWMSLDPYGQYASPYVGMGNNPLMRVDPDGGFDSSCCPPITLKEVVIIGGRVGNWWESAPSSYWGRVGMSANMAMYGTADYPLTNGEAFEAYMTYVAFVSTSQGSPGRVGSPINI